MAKTDTSKTGTTQPGKKNPSNHLALQTAGQALQQVPTDVLSSTMQMSFGLHNMDNQPASELLTVKELVQRLCVPTTRAGNLPSDKYHSLDQDDPVRKREKNGAYFMPAKFKRAGVRTASQIHSMSAFCGDIDHGHYTAADIQARLRGVFFIAYTSYSHLPHLPHWRFVVPYKQAIPPSEHRKIYEHFQKVFAGDLDKSCATTAQIWYSPACPPDATHEFEFAVGSGPLLDVSNVPDIPTAPSQAVAGAISRVVTHAGGNLTALEHENLSRALSSIAADEYTQWIRIGLALKNDLGETGFAIWIEWSKTSSKFELDQAEATWHSLSNPTYQGSKVGLGTIFYLARKEGWSPPSGQVNPKIEAIAPAP